MDWQAGIEWTAAPVADETGPAENMLDELAAHQAGAVTVPSGTGRWGVTIAVEAPTLRQATGLALSRVTAAASNAGLRRITFMSCEVTEQDLADERAERPDIPPVIGYAAIARTAGLSAERVRQLATAGAPFPAPLLETEYGPLFALSAVERYLATVERRSGRPRKKMSA